MADYQLYCFGESGNAYKAALMLNLCRIDWDVKFVDFFNGETRSEDYRHNINEMGEVPVLVHNAKSLTQSGVILDYLTGETGKFGYRDDDHRREVLRWMFFDNHKFTNNIATLRFLLTFAKSGETPVTEFLRARTKSSLVIADKHLEKREFITGNEVTIADLSMCGYLYYGDELGISLAPYANVGAWLDRIKAMPGWAHPYDLMPKGYKPS